MLHGKNRLLLSLPNLRDWCGLALWSPETKSLRANPARCLSLIVVYGYCQTLRAASCSWRTKSVWPWRLAGSWTGRSWCTRKRWHWRPTRSLKSSRRWRDSEWTVENFEIKLKFNIFFTSTNQNPLSSWFQIPQMPFRASHGLFTPAARRQNRSFHNSDHESGISRQELRE